MLFGNKILTNYHYKCNNFIDFQFVSLFIFIHIHVHTYRTWMHSMIIWVHYIRVSNSFQLYVLFILLIDLCKFYLCVIRSFLCTFTHTHAKQVICVPEMMHIMCVCMKRKWNYASLNIFSEKSISRMIFTL